MKVKDPDPIADTHSVREVPPPRQPGQPRHRGLPTPNVPSGRASRAKNLRRDLERKGGAMPIDHDAHHLTPKAGGKEAGEEMRDSLSQSSVSEDEAANGAPARGLPRDPRAPHESSSQHWNLHKKATWEAMRRELETVKGDDAATRDVLKKYGLDVLEDRKHEPPDFFLGGDPEPPDPPEPKPGKPRTPKK
jgi:hypothetical protein